MKAEAIIGANYGDEGKGLFTDYLCANRQNPIVIMTNGGSQRGHTVELEDGTRHVFHHFSAGTFRSAITYFPKSYLLNPMQFMKEYEDLSKLGHNPISYHHPECIIQLPCDIALNWHIEKARGEKKHGSVGCGIWETKYRAYNNDAMTLDSFVSMEYEKQFAYIHKQAKKYRDLRCREEKISRYAEIYDLFMSNSFIDHFIADCKAMSSICLSKTLSDISTIDSTLVFENGQGLRLDQFYNGNDEANTTPSFTGSIGIARLIDDEKISINAINLNYVSRTYLTKHGVGTFAEQSSFDENDFQFDDLTNVDNEWQDGLRFAELRYDELIDRCNKDTMMLKSLVFDKNIIVNKKIAMTHVNEIEIDKRYIDKIDFSSRSKFSKDIVIL